MRLVAVDGPSGAGKSTFAHALAAHFDLVKILSTDEFATWDDPVGWWPRLEEGVLRPFGHAQQGRYRRMEWPGGRPRLGEWITLDVPQVLILEGVSAGRRAVQDRLSALVWVEFPDRDARLERSVGRDGEISRTHLRRWQRFEAGWFAVDDPKARATHFSHPE